MLGLLYCGFAPAVPADVLVQELMRWCACQVRIHSSQIAELPDLLRDIPAERIAQMQARLDEVKRRYFLFPFETAFALVQLRVRELMKTTMQLPKSATQDVLWQRHHHHQPQARK